MASSNGNGHGGVWSKNTPLHYIAQVMRKLDDGTYPTVPTRCFCDCEPNDSIITTHDRYTIPHRIVLCENCMLMRANPRMTEDAYRQFYEIEYRNIYDGFPYGDKSQNLDWLFTHDLAKGADLKSFVGKFDIEPKTVVDIGSNQGSTLMVFKETGATVYGVEWSEHCRDYANTRGITTVQEVEELIARGVKADLIIMQDIIEHFMDLRQMESIGKLLAPRGYIFLFTPGFLATPPTVCFQNAHTFQFIGATLEYVMNQMGFVADFLDEHIISLWRYVGDIGYPEPPPISWRKHIMEHLEQPEKRTLPPVRTYCKFTQREMLLNLEANLQRRLPVIRELKNKYSGPVVVIGGGPSVDGQIGKIRELVKAGAKLVVIERMYPWCAKNGLKPDFVVQLDASDDVTDGFTHLQEDTKHLVCASTNPSVLKALEKHPVYLFSGVSGSYPDATEIWHKNGYDQVMIINTGSTVVLGSIFISLILGFRNVHLFGFDCMVPNTTDTYATGIAGKSVDRDYFTVCIGDSDEPVLTCAAFLAFAQQFFGMIETARKWGMIDSITVYGDSLINRMWDGDLTVVPTEQRENEVTTYGQ